MIILPIITTLLTHFSSEGWENVLFELESERVKIRALMFGVCHCSQVLAKFNKKLKPLAEGAGSNKRRWEVLDEECVSQQGDHNHHTWHTRANASRKCWPRDHDVTTDTWPWRGLWGEAQWGVAEKTRSDLDGLDRSLVENVDPTSADTRAISVRVRQNAIIDNYFVLDSHADVAGGCGGEGPSRLTTEAKGWDELSFRGQRKFPRDPWGRGLKSRRRRVGRAWGVYALVFSLSPAYLSPTELLYAVLATLEAGNKSSNQWLWNWETLDGEKWTWCG